MSGCIAHSSILLSILEFHKVMRNEISTEKPQKQGKKFGDAIIDSLIKKSMDAILLTKVSTNVNSPIVKVELMLIA